MKNEDWQAALDELEQNLGYTFKDRALLGEAMTHRSFSHERKHGDAPDNDRLEFLGDAVLGVLVGQRLFLIHPTFNSGRLTKERAQLVCEEALAQAARGLNLGPCLRLGVGEWRSGGSDKDSLLADAYESLLGAIFLDGGLDAARRVALRGLELTEEAAQQIFDAKSAFQEYCAKGKLGQPEYHLTQADGPDHLPVFTVVCRLNDVVVGSGEGRTRKQAEQVAAKLALEFLSRNGEAEE